MSYLRRHIVTILLIKIPETNKLEKSDELIVKMIEVLESSKLEADKKLDELELYYPEIFTQLK